MIAFLDASALIYLIEGAPPFAHRVQTEFRKMYADYPNLTLAVSRLSWLECRIHPMRHQDALTLRAFDDFFNHTDLIWVELTREVVEMATNLRVKHSLRTPDALQASCCLHLGSQHLFLTGDKDYQHVQGLNVRLLT
ncbi:MAG: PIN domain-containing protein [Betaproteobacteria bacterium]